MFWPNMNTDLKECISACSMCRSHETSQQREMSLTDPGLMVGTDLFSISETSYCLLPSNFWKLTIGEHMVITSSDQNRNYQGVGLIISKNLRKSVMSYNAVSSRIITIRIKARPANMSIIQIYSCVVLLIASTVTDCSVGQC